MNFLWFSVHVFTCCIQSSIDVMRKKNNSWGKKEALSTYSGLTDVLTAWVCILKIVVQPVCCNNSHEANWVDASALNMKFDVIASP